MSTFKSKSSASTAQANFDDMLKQFGVVTVMNAKVFKKALYGGTDEDKYIIHKTRLDDKVNGCKAYDILQALLDEAAASADNYVEIDTLKIANISMEGPTKTITGGQYTNPLIKFGKTATIEMQDALGRDEAIEALGGGIIEYFDQTQLGEESDTESKVSKVLHITQDFAGAKTILGESFFIDKTTGAQVKVYIILYEMLPDSIFNLTQDAEGDATVFDLNGSLSAVDILVSDSNTGKVVSGQSKGVFYSILPQVTPNSAAPTFTVTLDNSTTNPVSNYELLKLKEDYDTVLAKGASWTAPQEEGFVFTPDSISNISKDEVIKVSKSVVSEG